MVSFKVIVVIFALLIGSFVVNAKVSNLHCGPHEHLEKCAKPKLCQRSCKSPARRIVCSTSCILACVCNSGRVRNRVQQCVLPTIDDIRDELLLALIGTHQNKVTENLTDIAQGLNKDREEDDYVETDLKKWIRRLEKLRKYFTTIQTIDFDEDANNNTLVSKIVKSEVSINYIIDQTIGDIYIIENSRTVVQGTTHENAAVRGRGVLYSPE